MSQITPDSSLEQGAERAEASQEPDVDLSKHGVLLFDGVCNFCNGAVNFIIDRDPDNYFKFASLQSEAGQAYLRRFKLPTEDFNTMVLIENNSYHTKSSAGLRIARRLKGFWSLGYLLILVPKFVRDAVYDQIAKNRYSWFGKQDQCRLPTPEIRARFLG